MYPKPYYYESDNNWFFSLKRQRILQTNHFYYTTLLPQKCDTLNDSREFHSIASSIQEMPKGFVPKGGTEKCNCIMILRLQERRIRILPFSKRKKMRHNLKWFAQNGICVYAVIILEPITRNIWLLKYLLRK